MKKLEEIKSDKRVTIIKESQDAIGGIVYDKKTRVKMNFILSIGKDWEHCSVSITDRYKRCPSWEQMCVIKECFWNDDEVCMQLHPAKKDYINNHKYCLHIWKPINKDIPTPPSIMVGIKCNYSIDEINEIKSMIKNNQLPRW